MDMNSIILIVVFTIILLLLRGYMGLTLRLILNKKKRKLYQVSYSPLSRWFFLFTYRVVDDIKDKFEKRTIRYKAIMMIYKYIMLILHAELFLLISLCVFIFACDFSFRPFNVGCWVYTCTVICCFLVLAGIELYTNRRYHQYRYRTK